MDHIYADGPTASPVSPAERVEQLEQQLAHYRRLEQLFDLVVNRAEDYGFILHDTASRITGWNVGAERVFGYTEEQILGQPSAILFTPEGRDRGEPEQERAHALRDGRTEDETWHLRRDGTRFWGSGVMRTLYDDTGRHRGFLKIIRDLTARQETQEQLRRSEESLRLFVENVTEYALFQVSNDGRIRSWNTGAQRAFGYVEADVLDRPVEMLFNAEDIARNVPRQDLQEALEKGRHEETRWLVRRDGNRFWARWVTTPIRHSSGSLQGYAKVLRDETERHRAEERLRASLLERDVLLQEIHHRVKNNLQVVISLLDLQSDQLTDPAQLSLFQDTQNRVRAIASIHELLYSSSDLARIDFSAYAERLVGDLFAFYGVPEEHIQPVMEMGQVTLEITQAIPLGLILNELVTNSLKHAFPHGHAGTVRVTLREIESGTVELCVEDNGRGLPPDFDQRQQESLGMKLIRILVKQLQGRLDVRTEPRTEFRMQFPRATLPGAE